MECQGTEREQTRGRRLGLWIRIGVLALYAFLTLPVLTAIGFAMRSGYVLFPDMALRAVPLYLACWVDRTFYNGGELSPELLPVWVALTGVLLWPMPVLAVCPTLWRRRSWRVAIQVYSAAAFAATIAASRWVFTHTGTFF